jgi:hypothetical protein
MGYELIIVEGCYDLQLSAKGLLDSIGELWPVAPATAGGGPDGPSSLEAVVERLDDCRA